MRRKQRVTLAVTFLLLAFSTGNVSVHAQAGRVALASIAKGTPKDRQADCPRAIRTALAQVSSEMTYDPAAQRWSFAGISGELRLRRWDPYHDGPAFDVLQVYYSHRGESATLWAAVGVQMPAYYPIQNAASYDWYVAQNRGDQPYYVSFTQGVTSHDDAMHLFEQPGSHLVEIGIQGPHVSAQGVDWERCQPAYSEACFLGRMFDEVFVLPGEGTATNMSDLLIFTGQGPRHPLDGYLIWNVTPTRRLDLCNAK